MRGLKEKVWLAGCQGLLCGSLVVVWLGVRNESSAAESAADSPSLVTAPESGIVLQTLGIGLQTLAVILFASLASAIVRTCLGANAAVVDTADDFTLRLKPSGLLPSTSSASLFRRQSRPRSSARLLWLPWPIQL